MPQRYEHAIYRIAIVNVALRKQTPILLIHNSATNSPPIGTDTDSPHMRVLSIHDSLPPFTPLRHLLPPLILRQIVNAVPPAPPKTQRNTATTKQARANKKPPSDSTLSAQD